MARFLAPLLVAMVTVVALLPSSSVRWSADDSYVPRAPAGAGLIAADCWIRFRLTEKGVWLSGAVLALLAAVLSYEAAIAAPVLLLLADIALRRTRDPAGRGWVPPPDDGVSY